MSYGILRLARTSSDDLQWEAMGMTVGHVTLSVGSLVTWPLGPGAPTGVVVAAYPQQVSVSFDGDDELKAFSTRAGALERVALVGPVRRQSTGDVGIVQGMTTEAPPRWQVFVAGRVITRSAPS